MTRIGVAKGATAPLQIKMPLMMKILKQSLQFLQFLLAFLRTKSTRSTVISNDINMDHQGTRACQLKILPTNLSV